jgi:pyridoxine 5'-phosphate synthase PdxJ
MSDSRQWMLLRIFRYCSRLSVSCIVRASLILFVRPKPEQVQACAESGVKAIVLSVDRYVQARNDEERDQALSELQSDGY